jgi:SAM-dependent methyltransferase
MLSAASHVPLFYVILFCKYQDQKQEIKARLCMDQLNDRSVVEQQYATATNLQTRISIHDKYSTNKMGFGNWIFSNYKIDPGMRVLELGCGTGDMWKNKEDLIRLCSRLILSDFSKAMIAAAKSNIDDIIEYLYSLSSMTSITGIPKQAIKDILIAHSANGILNVPKEYGMFIVS